jgi:hypothetical protein
MKLTIGNLLKRKTSIIIGLVLLLIVVIALTSMRSVSIPDDVKAEQKKLPKKLDFNIHVKPILSDKCFSCHGPDKNTRKADLRLDTEEGAYAALKAGGGKVIVPGSIGRSEFVHRILTDEAEILMPPATSNLSLTAAEKATLIEWIDQGAEYKKHWAFIAPKKPAVPNIIDAGWKANNPIDKFVQATLETKGYAPSAEADKERLIRRVTLDLTGLPPTVEEIDAFVNDKSADAYDKLVNRLLSTDAYAERMAMDWMDVSRYADSHGMHADGWRMMWPWRDWVIKSFKENMPYDQFGTWQIAGDMLPNATQEQILATAFNRNHPMTSEGGVIDEEFRLKYVFDRANTVGTAFMALTMECSQCHDHKFDPISQKDYYSLTAFFNNVREVGMTGDDGNIGPMLLLTNDSAKQQLNIYNKSFVEKYNQIRLSEKEVQNINMYANNAPLPEAETKAPAIHVAFENFQPSSKMFYDNKTKKIDNLSNAYITGKGQLAAGKKGSAVVFVDEFDEVIVENTGTYEMNNPFSGAMWINTSKKEKGKTQTLIGNSDDKNRNWRGWDFFLNEQNQLSLRLIHSLPSNMVQVTTKNAININAWTHVGFSYDGLGKAEGIKIFVNGQPVKMTIDHDYLYKTIITKHLYNPKVVENNLKVGKSYRSFTGDNGIFKGMIDELYIYKRVIGSGEVMRLYNPEAALTKEMEKEQQLLLNPAYQTLQQQARELIGSKLKVVNNVPEIMVMEEMKQPRVTHVLDRGQYDAPKEVVTPNTPSSLLKFDEKKFSKDRLGLSKWLFDPANPLTARVTVNRYWQMIFGKGLVKSTHDFGNQGNLPTHPELLDWLAVTFMENKWNVKELLKLIVTSATYKQSSVASAKMLEQDPENMYLARGAKYRLSAEAIRDNALAISGLLVKKVGGESVKPYQPEGLWKEKSNFSYLLVDYVQGHGDDLYRRTMYTFIRRTSPPPSLVAFDATSREFCTVKRESTNTPLQALVLLNDPQYVEASRVLAVKLQKDAGDDLNKQIELLYRLTTSRKPKDSEREILSKLYNAQYNRFSKNSSDADKLLAIGEYPLVSGVNRTKTAALTIVCNTMLNHDECYIKR